MSNCTFTILYKMTVACIHLSVLQEVEKQRGLHGAEKKSNPISKLMPLSVSKYQYLYILGVHKPPRSVKMMTEVAASCAYTHDPFRGAQPMSNRWDILHCSLKFSAEL